MFGAIRTLRSAVVGCLVGVVLLGGAGPPPARASDDAADAESPPRYLTLDFVDAYLEFEGEYTHREVDSRLRGEYTRSQEQRNREWSFEERIGLTFGGAIIDPRFISFGGDFAVALAQDRYKEDIGGYFDQVDRDNGYLLHFDLRANFLQGKPVSGSAYGMRRDDRINRRFQPTLTQRRTGFGTSFVLTDDKFPMELSYDYLETDRLGNADRRDDEHFTESTLRYGLDWLINDHHKIKFSFEHANSKQEYQGLYEPFETRRDLIEIEQHAEFGDSYQHSWRTLIHWQDESGDFARDLFEVGPELTLKHSDNFRTLYKYQFNREEYQGLDVDTHRVDVQLVHQAYTNLTTTAGVFGQYEDVEDDIETTDYGAWVDWQYNRRNRFGHLYANLAVTFDREDVDGKNSRRIILDESHTFRDPVAITLRNRNITEASIIVTDSTNRRVFLLGADYVVTRLGNATQVVRIRSGRIADGDTVFIDYQFRIPAHGEMDTLRTDFSIEQRFKNGVTPYYRLSYRHQDDDVTFGYASRADRTDHHRIGATYEAKKYTFGAEVEIFDDSIDPYDAFHLNGMVHIVQRPDQTVDASARFSRLFFEGGYDDRNVTMLDLELDHHWRISEALSTVERVAYRYEDNSIDGRTNDWDVVAGLEYLMGDFSGELTFEYDRLDLPESGEDNFGVYLRMRRELPNVLGGR